MATSTLVTVLMLFTCLVGCKSADNSVNKYIPIYKCATKGDPNAGKPFPKLDQRFHSRIEAKSLLSNMTHDLVQYYDSKKNMASTHVTAYNVTSIFIYDFASYTLHKIKGRKCNNLDIRKAGCTEFWNFTEGTHGGHVDSADNIFYIGGRFNTAFYNYTEIRNIPVSHWTSCYTRINVKYEVDSYFSRSNYEVPIGKRSIPVQIRIKATLMEGSDTRVVQDNVYDYVFYRPGLEDKSAFKIPRGVVCSGVNAPKSMELPKIPDHFSMHIEIVIPKYRSVQLVTQYFDYSGGLTRLDFTPAKVGPTMYRNIYGRRPLRVINDFKTGLQYVMDEKLGNCSITKVPKYSGDAKSLPNDTQHVVMRHGMELFNVNLSTLSYKGPETIRDIPCEVWVTDNCSWPMNSTCEFYFAAGNWSCAQNPEPTKLVLVGAVLYGNGSAAKQEEYITHMFGFCSGKPLISYFDVQPCFDRQANSTHFMFRIIGAYNEWVYEKKNYIGASLRRAVARRTGIEEIRVTGIHFEETTPGLIDVWMTILQTPHVVGNVAHPIQQPTMQEAYTRLKEAIHSQSVVSIKYQHDLVNLTIVQDSLRTDKEVVDPRVVPVIAKSGYSSASMGTLAFFMLLIGLVGGVGVGYFMWSRRLFFNYQRYT